MVHFFLRLLLRTRVRAQRVPRPDFPDIDRTKRTVYVSREGGGSPQVELIDLEDLPKYEADG